MTTVAAPVGPKIAMLRTRPVDPGCEDNRLICLRPSAFEPAGRHEKLAAFGMNGEPRPYNAVARYETAKDWAMHIFGFLLILTLAFSASAPALAQSGVNPAVQAACRGDAQRFCRGIQPGEGRIGKCLKEHIAEVSPGCLEAVKASRQGAHPPR
jgi:hypothetical protein